MIFEEKPLDFKAFVEMYFSDLPLSQKQIDICEQVLDNRNIRNDGIGSGKTEYFWGVKNNDI